MYVGLQLVGAAAGAVVRRSVARTFGGAGVNDEERVLRGVAGETAVKVMVAPRGLALGKRRQALLVGLIGALAHGAGCQRIYIQRRLCCCGLTKEPKKPRQPC